MLPGWGGHISLNQSFVFVFGRVFRRTMNTEQSLRNVITAGSGIQEDLVRGTIVYDGLVFIGSRAL